MKRFLTNLKYQAQENPLMTLAFGATALTVVGQFIERTSHARGSHAYARDVNRRIKNSK